jgi:hypothetical protein
MCPSKLVIKVLMYASLPSHLSLPPCYHFGPELWECQREAKSLGNEGSALNKEARGARHLQLTLVILPTQEAEIRRIAVRSKPGKKL